MGGDTSSYVHGVGTHPLVGLTVGALFDGTVRRNPQSEALAVPQQGVRWSWQQLSDEVDALAAGLHALGRCVGERIGIPAPMTVTGKAQKFKLRETMARELGLQEAE